MRLFFLTHSVIGSTYDQNLILNNRKVVLMGLNNKIVSFNKTMNKPYFLHLMPTNTLTSEMLGKQNSLILLTDVGSIL